MQSTIRTEERRPAQGKIHGFPADILPKNRSPLRPARNNYQPLRGAGVGHVEAAGVVAAVAAAFVFRQRGVLLVIGEFAQAAEDDERALKAGGGVEGADGDMVLTFGCQGVEFQHGQGCFQQQRQDFLPLPATGAEDEDVPGRSAAGD